MRGATGRQRCPRCQSHVECRKPNSLSRTWALLLTAALFYIPANTLPVMTTSYFGHASTDTIMSGVIYFLRHGDWPLALIIFLASIVIPLTKIATLGYLLISVHRGSAIRFRERARLYRITELIGRWSMVDVFVVAMLTALVHMGTLAEVKPGWGAAAFAGVVILTMIAVRTFDPRLIWDHQQQINSGEPMHF
ncbi:MAG: paraquat-inducible protein A [Chromatiaceae bacterium]|nr:paraquat-inducible protein A [Chromatiaceae bacterium]